MALWNCTARCAIQPIRASCTSFPTLDWAGIPPPPFYELPQNKGSATVFFIGDSFTHGKLWPRFAQEHAGTEGQAFRGYSFGVSGYGTLQAFLKLQRTYDLFTPQLVVLLFFAWNDLRDNSGYPSLYYNDQTVRRPVIVADGGNQRISYTLPTFLASSRAFKHFFLKAYCRISDYVIRHFGMDFISQYRLPLVSNYTDKQGWDGFYRPSSQNSQYVQEAWAATETSLVRIKQFLDARSTKLLVLGIDNAFTVDHDVYTACISDPGGFDRSLPLRRLGAVLQKYHIPYINCLPMQQRHSALWGDKLYLGGADNLSAHLTPAGERVIGEIAGKAVAEFLRQGG